ncbi:MAG: CHRD domain-containing protein [Gaiellaceae bacterium]
MRRSVKAVLVGLFTVLALGVGSVGANTAAIPLNAEQETTGSTSTGSGFFSYTIDGDQLCYTLEVRDLTLAPFAAHIHVAPRNVAGPIVVGLLTPPAETSTVSACIAAEEGATGQALSTAELAAIAADPRAYYANVHTTNWPGGEVRGQLK